jgi:hypothetical protein
MEAVSRSGQPHVVMQVMQVMEGDMKNLNWNGMIQTLVLVRLGQELGTDSRLARALHDLFDAVLTVVR